MLAQQCAVGARPLIHHHPKVVENLDGRLHVTADRAPLGSSIATSRPYGHTSGERAASAWGRSAGRTSISCLRALAGRSTPPAVKAFGSWSRKIIVSVMLCGWTTRNGFAYASLVRTLR